MCVVYCTRPQEESRLVIRYRIHNHQHISSIDVQYSKLSVCPSVGIRSTTVELTTPMFSTSRLHCNWPLPASSTFYDAYLGPHDKQIRNCKTNVSLAENNTLLLVWTAGSQTWQHNCSAYNQHAVNDHFVVRRPHKPSQAAGSCALQIRTWTPQQKASSGNIYSSQYTA